MAALCIIKGSVVPYDVLEARQAEPDPALAAIYVPGAAPTTLRAGPRITFASSCIGWGFVGDVLEGELRLQLGAHKGMYSFCVTDNMMTYFTDIEKHRWLGRSRTVICGLKKMFSPVTSHEGTVWIRPSTGESGIGLHPPISPLHILSSFIFEPTTTLYFRRTGAMLAV